MREVDAIEAAVSTKLLSLLYASATDRTNWQLFCNELSAVTGGPVIMFGHAIDRNEHLGSLMAGLDPAAAEVHDAHYAHMNPWMHMNLVMRPGEVGLSDQALAREDLFKTEYYNDWLRHQDNVVAGAALMCHRSSERFVLLITSSRGRDVDHTLPAGQALLENLAPHAMRATEIASALSSGGRASFAHLNALSHGIFILRRSGRVGYHNAAAERIMSSTACLKIDHAERLVSANDRIGAYLARATKILAENKVHHVLDPLMVNCPPLGVCNIHTHIFPSEADHGFPCSAWHDPVVGAIVVTGQLGMGRANDFAKIASAFGASPAEARLANAVMLGGSLNDYADKHRLSRHTVRNQMRALLQKSGTHSQSEFIVKLMAHASPFADT